MQPDVKQPNIEIVGYQPTRPEPNPAFATVKPYPFGLSDLDLMKVGMVTVVDLESLSTKPNAQICSIGAVIVDVIELRIMSKLYLRIDHELQHSRHFDPKTEEWWEAQKDKHPAAYLEIFGEELPRIDLESALDVFAMFLAANYQRDQDVIVMGNGSEFDNVILSDAYESNDRDVPWKFRDNQSLRTVKWLSRVVNEADPQHDVGFIGERHHALDDALNEARALIAEVQLFRMNQNPSPSWFVRLCQRFA